MSKLALWETIGSHEIPFRVLFYVNEHGSGHAVRAARVLRRLTALRPDVAVIVNSAKNQEVLAGLKGVFFRENPVQIGADICEVSPFEIDGAKTAVNLLKFQARRSEIIESESSWVEANKIALIVCDIPWLPGAIAKSRPKGGLIPCVGIANFLWDWITEPMLSGLRGSSEVLRSIKDDFAQMDAILKMPFSHAMEDLPNICPAPWLDAEVSARTDEAILESMGVTSAGRPIAHVSMRLDVLGADLPEFIRRHRAFTFIQSGAVSRRVAENHFEVRETEFCYPDMFKVADVMIGKAGYGMMTACAANGASLLCVERTGFREDDALLSQGAELFPLRQISYQDFTQGRWAEGLEALSNAPSPQKTLPLGGADYCAKFIGERIS